MSEQITTAAKSGKATDPAAALWPRDPVTYLIQRGWSPEGDPRHPAALWYDPAKPREATQEWRFQFNRKLPNNADEPVNQLFITPAAFGCSVTEAVSEQLRRDREAGEQGK